jgi:hypothetical protein
MIVLSLFLPPNRQEQPMRPTDRNRFRKDAEARFPIKVDIARAYGEPWPYADNASLVLRKRALRGVGAAWLHGLEPQGRQRRPDGLLPVVLYERC